uniref:Glycosyltransferase n=1 Tax=viral metagenome TaxID=1070528 RepID=A0A6C0FGF0_9ZZZZ|tara:strand:- start:23856 stop:24644 length:789 start_codon:yes stop_codon:yes gene_type:complete
MKKIAFCFLIYDIIHGEALWKTFFENVDKNKYIICIHYKYDKQLAYFENYKIKNCIETKYADISLVQAQNLLLENALQDKEVEHFVFLSDTCVPFKNFDYIYNFLDENYSHFNVTDQKQCFPRCNKSIELIDKQIINKASQWCILNKKHANIMVNEKDYLKWFNYSETVPDEHCYITKIFYNNLQDELITTNNIATGATTFVNWQGMDYKYPSKRGLKYYNNISKEEIIYILQSDSIFGRKFKNTCIKDFLCKEYLESIKTN